MHIGIHGSKLKHKKDIIVNGVHRNSSAWFIVSGRTEQKDEIKRSIFLSLYFGLSLSTLRKYQESNELSLKEFLLKHIDCIPCLYLFPYKLDDKHYYNYYEINYCNYSGTTLPYTKTENSEVIPFNNIFEVIDCSKLIHELDDTPLKTIDYTFKKHERFFKKKNDFYSYPNTGLLTSTEILAAEFCTKLEPFVTREFLKTIS
ncbi:hypothetical protein JDS87_26425 [Bacillus cereus]|uniref:hypothetical protein n=1 Tax=Bacillus cereus TaxID=1396 RepID=UPI0018F52ED2|nr:hypothetical protein [Bacillus cereus]MBJ8055379.1 hypothetical protein [Bacillus cereus]